MQIPRTPQIVASAGLRQSRTLLITRLLAVVEEAVAVVAAVAAEVKPPRLKAVPAHPVLEEVQFSPAQERLAAEAARSLRARSCPRRY